MKNILGSLFFIVLIIGLTACGQGEQDKKSNDKLSIKTTVYPLQSMIEQIGGEHVKVSSIYPAGTDLHSYEPTQKEMLDVNKSDLFIYTGDNLDAVAKKIASTIKKDDKKLSLENQLDKTELLTDQHHHDEENHDSDENEEHHQHGGYDPHVWLDPKMNLKFAKEIKKELVKKDPSNKKEYESNYKKLKKDVENIDKKLVQITKDKKGNAVFISHESIGYLANRYGFVQKGIQNMNAEDPSQKELTQIVKDIKKQNVKYILYEDNVANKVTETIRKETNAKPLKFYNMESLNKEQKHDKDLTYQKLMNQNIEALEKALSHSYVVKDDKSEHKHDKAISDGYFKNSQVKNRSLSDYEGDWQSVYPYLKDGTLDEVMKHKAEDDSKMNANQYKSYYEKGYKTNVNHINIKGDTITFEKNKKSIKGKYEYLGYKILKYEKGNRGVRYMFKLVDSKNKDLPQYVQFSDHNIYPKKAEHFHIFMGDDNDSLLKEMDHWPTYYPNHLTKEEIKEEMLHH